MGKVPLPVRNWIMYKQVVGDYSVNMSFEKLAQE